MAGAVVAAAPAAAGALFTPQQLAFCQQLPKIELHAHLNGCVRPATLVTLEEEWGGVPGADLAQLTHRGPRTLEDCFDLFAVVHRWVLLLA